MKLIKKENKITLDDLAVMTAAGFKETKKELNEFRKENAKEHEETKKELNEFRKENAKEHEEIKLRLDNVAYRFEVVDLERRVKKLEMKLKIA